MNFGSSGDILSSLSSGLSSPSTSLNGFFDSVGNTLLTGATNAAASAVSKATNGALGRSAYSYENVLQKMLSRGEPVMSFDWIGVIIDSSIAAGSQLPWQYIDGITLPSMDLDTHKFFFNGVSKNTASTYSAGSAEIKLFTDVNATSFNYANYWFRSTYRQDGYYNLPSKYKKDIQVFILDPTRVTVVDFRMIGCFPTQYASYPLTGDNSILETTLSLAVDEFYMNYDSDASVATNRLESLFGRAVSNITDTSAIGSLVGSSLSNSIFGG